MLYILYALNHTFWKCSKVVRKALARSDTVSPILSTSRRNLSMSMVWPDIAVPPTLGFELVSSITLRWAISKLLRCPRDKNWNAESRLLMVWQYSLILVLTAWSGSSTVKCMAQMKWMMLLMVCSSSSGTFNDTWSENAVITLPWCWCVKWLIMHTVTYIKWMMLSKVSSPCLDVDGMKRLIKHTMTHNVNDAVITLPWCWQHEEAHQAYNDT